MSNVRYDAWRSDPSQTVPGEWQFLPEVYLRTKLVLFVRNEFDIELRRWREHAATWTTLQTFSSLNEAKQVYLVMAEMEVA